MPAAELDNAALSADGCRQSVGVTHQGRGRRGKSGARLRTDDAVEEVAQVTPGAATVAS